VNITILEFKNIESICIEILVGNKKWLISGVYRPQTINDKTFKQQFLRRTLFDQHAKSDNCLLEIVRLGIGSQFWFQPRIAYQLYLMLIIHIYDRIYISNCLYRFGFPLLSTVYELICFVLWLF
jgi:hypothetical protein